MNDYRYSLTLKTPAGSPLGGVLELLELDDEPAREWARFRNFLDEGNAVPPPVMVNPLWDACQGAPFVAGLRVACNGSEHQVPRQYFESVARQYSRQLLADGVLQKGDRFCYVITAERNAAVRPVRSGLSIEVEEDPAPWRFRPGSPEDLIEGPVVSVGADFRVPGDLPVFVPEQVLDEASELTLRAAAIEVGGILLGHLCRDPESGRAGLVVAAQIAAAHTEAGEAHLTFTAQTWAAVSHALALRRDGSMIAGWWHSHPASHWCKPDCAGEVRASCPLQRPFFSEMDAHLHRAVFCQGYAVALVLTNTGNGIQQALYGWRDGLVQRRAFQVTGCRKPAGSYAVASGLPAVIPSECASRMEP